MNILTLAMFRCINFHVLSEKVFHYMAVLMTERGNEMKGKLDVFQVSYLRGFHV